MPINERPLHKRKATVCNLWHQRWVWLTGKGINVGIRYVEAKRLRVLVAAGAFKQSLTAAEVCAAIARGLEQSGLGADIEQLPIADGGNGTLDAFLATGGERVTVSVLDPLRRPIQADYGLIGDGRTAVIEMALASGLELLTPAELNPLIATTFGTGQLMADAMERGGVETHHHRLGRQRDG